MTQASRTTRFAAFLKRWAKRLLILPPIAAAIAVLVFVVEHRPPLTERPETEVARTLRTFPARSADVRPRVVGYGTAEYARKWRAISQVGGRLLNIHPELRPGAVIEGGAVLLTIDDADYRLAVEELTASIEQKNAEIEQLRQTAANYDKTLRLERDVLAVLDKELERAEGLLAQRAGAQASIDAKQRDRLAQQQVIQEIENNKALIEPQVAALRAGVRQSTAQLRQAERDVDRTEIRAPFTMRVGDVDLEPGQFVAANESLFEGYSVAEMEIEVQLSMLDMERLLTSVLRRSRGAPAERTMESMRSGFNVESTVFISGGGAAAVYRGRFLRIREVLDATTRQVGLVIGVTHRPGAGEDGPRPPVLEGAFCRVELLGESIGERIVVPRSAVHGSTVYVADADDRLDRREIVPEFFQDDYAVVASGLDEGDRVILSDPSPAVDGMLVDPVNDPQAADALLAEVSDGP